MSVFLREFVRNWRSIGAIAPSSPLLAKQVVHAAGVKLASHVLELGAGTGAFTAAISQALPASSRYLGLDINPAFVADLKNRFPSFRFEAGPAEGYDFPAYLQEANRFDVVVSGLPWTAFPEPLQDAILDNVTPHLEQDATFVTFAYVGFHLLPNGMRFRQKLQERFRSVQSTRVTWINLPPAFVYIARR